MIYFCLFLIIQADRAHRLLESTNGTSFYRYCVVYTSNFSDFLTLFKKMVQFMANKGQIKMGMDLQTIGDSIKITIYI